MLRILFASICAFLALKPENAPAATYDETSGEVTLVPELAPIPVGLYAMVSPGQLESSASEVTATSNIARICSRSYARAISAQILWRDLEPSPGVLDTSIVGEFISQVDAACALNGRAPLPIVLRVYSSSLPEWVATEGASRSAGNAAVWTHSEGFKLIRVANSSGTVSTDYPLTTDTLYQQKVSQLAAAIGDALDEYDPDGMRIRWISTIGPSMTSNTMRIPDGLSPFLPSDGSNDSLGAGWNLTDHIAAFRDSVSAMASVPAFAARSWAFNFTSQPAFLPTAVQADLLSQYEQYHPMGADALIAKTESLTVDFSRRNSNPQGSGAIQAQWKWRMLNNESTQPYSVIAALSLRHGWENWSGLHSLRDDRAPSMYSLAPDGALAASPLAEIQANSVYVDLGQSNPSSAQGTLFNEVWVQEFTRGENIALWNGASVDLTPDLTAWDLLLRTNIAQFFAPELDLFTSQSVAVPNGGFVSVGDVGVGVGESVALILRNSGTTGLTNISATIQGLNAEDFQISESLPSRIAPSEAVQLTIRFVASAAGTRTATVTVISDDADENPMTIHLGGRAFSTVVDTDEDGMNDWQEQQLAALGFDPAVEQQALVQLYFSTAHSNGLYTASQIEALSVGRPLLRRDQTSGLYTLKMKVAKSANLSEFSPFPMTEDSTEIDTEGALLFRFSSTEPVAFFRVEAE